MTRSPSRILALCILIAIGACTPRERSTTTVVGTKRGGSATPVPVKDADLLAALDDVNEQVKLSVTETTEPPEGAADQVPTAKTQRLSDGDTQRVLDRLPPMPGLDTDQKSFAFRDRSLPPPRAGETIKENFPPDAQADVVQPKAKPVEVLRFAPDGEVALAPHVSVTFNQPMVPITTHAELAKLPVPVRLTPEPKGEWRWVGTQTVLFASAAERMPMATEYTVEVPAGTKSATGTKLAAAKTFHFATPPATVKQFYPINGPTVTDPLFFAGFDQHIDPQAVLETIHVHAKGADAALRLATDAEIEADEVVKEFVHNAKEGTWLAFRATSPLPGDTNIRVSVGPGTPSEEGSRKTTSAYTTAFRTFGPLKVTRHRCGWSRRCRPGEWWTIEFNNPLNEETFTDDLVQVEPKLAGMVTYASYNTITIRGDSKGRTNYKVTVSGTLGDKFGQTLGKDATMSFDVGRADRMITGSGQNLVSLDPAGGTTFPVYTTNYSALSVQIYAVQPKDWNAYLAYLEKINGYRRGTPVPPGRRVFNKTVKIDSKPDDLVETRLDLTSALKDGLGHAVVIVRPRGGKEYERIIAWVQSTQIGLDALVDRSEMFAWATRLADGTPQEGVELQILPGGDPKASAADGVAVLPLPAKQASKPSVLVAKHGNDVAILPEQVYWWRGASQWYHHPAGDVMRWHVFDDRHMYKPKEEINVKGWVRMVGMERLGDVETIPPAGKVIHYKVQDAQGNEVAKGKTKLKGLGGFDFKVKLPDNMNLGWAQLILDYEGAVAGDMHYHSFQVQEFRRPEFEVKATAGEGPFVLGGDANVSVRASYYAGGGLPNADLVWRVFAEGASYSPPNWEGWIFGRWRPWWLSYYDQGRRGPTETLKGKTDADGSHRIKISFDDIAPPEPVTVRAEATVRDVNRQAWTARSQMLVHPSDLYVGLKTERSFVGKGEPIVLQAIVVDQEGHAQGGRKIAVRASRMVWKRVKGQWQQVEAEPDTKIVKTPKNGRPVEVRFEPAVGGAYKIKTSVLDDRGRPNRSELTIWMAGGEQAPDRGVNQQEVTLIPNKEIFHGGESAELLVQAPFAPAEGLVTLRRSGIVETQRFRMEESSYTLEIPIKDAYVPNVHVHVDLVGAAARGPQTDGAAKLPPRPAFATGSLDLKVPPVQRTLAVTAKPAVERIEPGGKTRVAIEVRDAKGAPVSGAEVAVVVVDEAVLALSGYQIPDPLESFYFERTGDTTAFHQRAFVMLASNKELEEAGDKAGEIMLDGASGGGGRGPYPSSPAAEPVMRKAEGRANSGFAMDEFSEADAEMPMEEKSKDSRSRNGHAAADDDDDSSPIAMRSDFRSLVTFSPMVSTNSSGTASVPIEIPDNLTRYRITAVAAAGIKQFGKGESTITARLPLMVRASPPRFLNFGDTFELPVVLQNQTDDPMTVNVAVRSHNAAITDGAGRRVTVPANDRVEVRFPSAADRPGTARFQVGGVSGKWTDAAQFEFPVWTPATTEAFASYGVIDDGAIAQPVLPPSGVVPEFGGLEVTTSSTAVQALTDAFIYVLDYPFGCSEQISSRVLAVAGLKDVLGAFDAEGLPDEKTLVASVGRDLERLELLQNNDGGFGFWYRGQQSWPWVSIHVGHALVRAKQKGFDVNEQTIKRNQNYLKHIDRHIPSWYSEESKLIIRSFALYVRHQNGDTDVSRARKLIHNYGGVEKMPLETLGFLLPVLHGHKSAATELAAIHHHLANRVTETAAGAHFATHYSDGDHVLLHSDRRADAIILEGLIVDKPKSDLIPKIVNGLLAHRRRGAWASTQENAFVLLALDKYFATYEKQTPDFVARVWLGDGYAGDHSFKGRTTERSRIDIPMEMVLAPGADRHNLVVSKEGKGRLYYRIGMSYAPVDLSLPPMDRGFTVERTYEPVEDEDDVRRDADGTWRIRAGAQVRVRLTMVAPTRRYHVALVDPVPAGIEPENPALATTGTLPEDPAAQKGPWWWWRTWYEHQNLRDERVEAFTSLLWGGVYEYTYYARATTPGHFVVPPTKAEEMYHPETFGRSGTDRVIVEPATGTLAKTP